MISRTAIRAGLPPELADGSLQVIDEIEGDFHDAIADDANWGPAKKLAMKKLAMQMLAARVDFSDVEGANRWLVAQGLAM